MGGRGWGSFWGRSEQDFLEGEMVCLLGFCGKEGANHRGLLNGS